MTTFTAAYRSLCPACDEPIHPGDPARFEGSTVRHDTCPTPTVEPVRAICGRCFLEVAISNECGCDPR